MDYKTTNCTRVIAILVFFVCLGNNVFSQFPSWSSISPGTNGVVKAIIEYKTDLIVAGAFSTPGKNIAKYNGYRWDTLGRGTNDTIYALAIYNNKLIAAGAFDSAGGVVSNNIAQWDGVAWSPLGLGTNNTIFTIDSIRTFLIVGGRFTSAGGISCSRVAKWQGTSWSALGSGVNDNVYALEWFNDNLIIGGAFTMAGTDTAKRIVKYDLDSGSYSPLGVGIDSNNVFALKSNLGNLYVGGDFTTIGGDSVKRFAQWNDTNWLAIASGMNGPVRVLDSLGAGVLRIGGSFTNAGGVSANNIVAYASLSFSPYGGGLSGGTAPSVNSIITWRGITVAGGSFTSGGTNVSRWALLPAAPELILPEDTAIGISVTPLFTWTMGPWMYSFTIQVARDPNFLNITLTDSTLLVPQLQVPGSTPLQNLTLYFWRVRASNGLGNGPWSLIRYFTTGFIGIINNNEVPLKFNLYQNYPNPFNPVTKIKFDLPLIKGDAVLKLNIFSITGEKVAELLNTDYAPGKWELEFDGSNFASGIYFCKIEAGPFVSTNKMILLK